AFRGRALVWRHCLDAPAEAALVELEGGFAIAVEEQVRVEFHGVLLGAGGPIDPVSDAHWSNAEPRIRHVEASWAARSAVGSPSTARSRGPAAMGQELHVRSLERVAHFGAQ